MEKTSELSQRLLPPFGRTLLVSVRAKPQGDGGEQDGGAAVRVYLKTPNVTGSEEFLR